MSMSCPFAVLMFILLSEILPNKPSVATVSYLIPLTCAPVLKREENTKPPTLILNVVPLVLPVLIKKTSLLS